MGACRVSDHIKFTYQMRHVRGNNVEFIGRNHVNMFNSFSTCDKCGADRVPPN